MDDLKSIIDRKRITIDNNVRINNKFERAKQFLEYVGLDASRSNIIFVLKLCKQYSPDEVLSLRSWLKDMNFDTSRWKGLIVWKLKNKGIISSNFTP